MTNGTMFTINTVPCTVVGKTEEGRVIVQTESGMQINFTPEMLSRVKDEQE
jgi:hypothetical protein